MTNFAYLLVTVLTSVVVQCQGVRIAMLHMFGGSHYMTTKAVGEELANRGHQVTICSPKEKALDGTRKTLSNSLRVLNFHGGHNDTERDRRIKELTVKRTSSPVDNMSFLKFSVQELDEICKHVLQNRLVLEEIEKADLLVAEIGLSCSGVISKAYNKRWIALAAASYAHIICGLQDVYLNPSYFPDAIGVFGEDMTFFQRVVNYIVYQASSIMHLGFSFSKWINTARELGYQDVNVLESMRSAEMIIGNCDFALLFAYPQLPNYICAGAFGTKPASKLPKELDDFMNTSENGVVLVAFGTAFGFFAEWQKQTMLAAFAKLKENVLWQIKDDINMPLPPNVKTVKWVPQNDLLGHHNLKLFVSHVGQSSMLEAGYHGVPVLAVPRGIDQFFNARIVRDKAKMGEILDIHMAHAEDWFQKIRTVLDDPRYLTNAKKTSRRMRTKRRSGIENAGDLVEYVIDNDYDVSHLRSGGLSMPWYSRALLDVRLFITSVLLLLAVTVYGLTRFLVRESCKQKRE